MGLLDLLSKEGRAKSALSRHARRVIHKHIQTEDRFASFEKLREIGTDEAFYYLTRRFSFVYDKTIVDEKEKEWVFDVLVARGERSIAPVRRYAMEAETLAWPLRILERVSTPARLLEIVDELLAREEPGYSRDPSRKIQLLTWMSEWKAVPPEELARRAVPYLADFDETVRFNAAEALGMVKHEAIARLPLLDALCRPEEESRRIKVKIADVLAEAGWVVTERKERVARLLAEELPEYGMAHDKLVSKRDKDKGPRTRDAATGPVKET